MKALFVCMTVALVAGLGAVTSVPLQVEKPPVVGIIDYVNQVKEDGSYSYRFKSEDGTRVEVNGNQKQVGTNPTDDDGFGTASSGSYSYIAPDGTPISVTWTADENGFQPKGSHLPTVAPHRDHLI